jgi:hypothetical protein
MRRLLLDGVPTRRGVMAIHEEASYADPTVSLPNTESASRSSLMLPLFAGLPTSSRTTSIDRLAAASRRHRRVSRPNAIDRLRQTRRLPAGRGLRRRGDALAERAAKRVSPTGQRPLPISREDLLRGADIAASGWILPPPRALVPASR